MRIAVAGGTGTVGRLVVAAVREVGHEPVVLSRSSGVDLVTGAGLAEALSGVTAVIDASSTSTLRAAASVRFFRTATRNLLRAGRSSGVRHHVALSIVGAAAVDAGYYAGKAAQEQEVVRSGDDWSLLRTTQFHEFALQMLRRGAVGGIVLAPDFRARPVAAAEVAGELVRVATADPAGLVPDLAGPREESMPDLVRRCARALGRRGPVLGVPLPGPFGRALRDGAVLPPPGTREGAGTFDEWLASLAATARPGG